MLEFIKKLIKSEKPISRKPSRTTSDWLDAACNEKGVTSGFYGFVNGKYGIFKLEIGDLMLTLSYVEYKNLKALEQPNGISKIVELTKTMSLNPTVEERILATVLEETPSALLNINVDAAGKVTISVYGSTMKIVTSQECYHVAKFIVR